MGLLDRKKLLEKEQLEIVKVDFEDGDFVYVRQMTARERDEYEQSLVLRTKDNKGRYDYDMRLENFRAKLAVRTLCDKDGTLLLKPGDFATLGGSMSARRMERIVNEAQRLNAITEEDKEALIKNSDAGLAGSSSSDSAES